MPPDASKTAFRWSPTRPPGRRPLLSPGFYRPSPGAAESGAPVSASSQELLPSQGLPPSWSVAYGSKDSCHALRCRWEGEVGVQGWGVGSVRGPAGTTPGRGLQPCHLAPRAASQAPYAPEPAWRQLPVPTVDAEPRVRTLKGTFPESVLRPQGSSVCGEAAGKLQGSCMARPGPWEF